MQTRPTPFAFGPTFNFGVDSVFVVKNDDQHAPFPPIGGNFELLDGTPMLLLDGSDFLLL